MRSQNGGVAHKRVGPDREEGISQKEAIPERERSTMNMRGSKEAMVRSQIGGMAHKRIGPEVEGGNGAIPE